MSHEWQGTGTLTRVGGDDVEPGEEFEPTEAELTSFGDVIDAVEENADTGGEEADSEGGEDGSEAGEVPLEEKEYSELRSMAVDADTDEINGRSSEDEIIAYFEE